MYIATTEQRENYALHEVMIRQTLNNYAENFTHYLQQLFLLLMSIIRLHFKAI